MPEYQHHEHVHRHSHSEKVELERTLLERSDVGIRTVYVSLAGLLVTSGFQLLIVIPSGSAGLLADCIHNLVDASSALPLWLAFALARRPGTLRTSSGSTRAEDAAGAGIVLLMLGSVLLAGYQSLERLLHPEPLRDVGLVMAAAIVGFAGNEAIASFRMRMGRRIGSTALLADGRHARIDGWTSLAVLFGAIGSLLGFRQADPLIGLLITIAMLFVVLDTGATIWRQLRSQ